MFLRTINFGDYKNPIIPDGFEYISGDWDNLQIWNRCTGDIWNWLPIGAVDVKAILPTTISCDTHGVAFGEEKFGSLYYNEEPDSLLIEALEKTGGVYLPAYFLSKGKEGIPQSIPGKYPWVDISWDEAMIASKQYTQHLKMRDGITTTLISGMVYDALCIWLMQKKAHTWEEMVQNSTNWGNYIPESGNEKSHLIKAGENPKYIARGYDWLAGNVQLWTTEKYHNFCRVVRSGSYEDTGEGWHTLGSPATARMAMMPEFTSPTVSFMMQMLVS